MIEGSLALRNVLIGASALGLLGGILGSFALLRRQSLLGDALAHAALPGVCIAFLVSGGQKSGVVLLSGAMVAGVVGAFSILAVVRGSRIKEDAAIGIVLSVFFGLGIVLLTGIQRMPGGNQSGLDRFLFGQAATLGTDDVVGMVVVGAIVLAVVAALFKEFKIVTFDRAFAASLGLPVRAIEAILTALLVVVVVVGLQAVGVVLMVATLLTPAAAARQWTHRLGLMVLLSGAVGAACGGVGAVASASIAGLPTGPAIVLLSSTVFVLSLLFAPARGILWALARDRGARARIRRENVLKDLYLVAERGAGFDAHVGLATLLGVRGEPVGRIARAIRTLVDDGSIERSGDRLRLTVRGRDDAARVVRKHRLWELYLTRRLEIAPDHVHRDAEAMEHALSDEAVEDLAEVLGHPEVDPHGRPIPGPLGEAAS